MGLPEGRFEWSQCHLREKEVSEGGDHSRKGMLSESLQMELFGRWALQRISLAQPDEMSRFDWKEVVFQITWCHTS